MSQHTFTVQPRFITDEDYFDGPEITETVRSWEVTGGADASDKVFHKAMAVIAEHNRNGSVVRMHSSDDRWVIAVVGPDEDVQAAADAIAEDGVIDYDQLTEAAALGILNRRLTEVLEAIMRDETDEHGEWFGYKNYADVPVAMRPHLKSDGRLEILSL